MLRSVMEELIFLEENKYGHPGNHKSNLKPLPITFDKSGPINRDFPIRCAHAGLSAYGMQAKATDKKLKTNLTI